MRTTVRENTAVGIRACEVDVSSCWGGGGTHSEIEGDRSSTDETRTLVQEEQRRYE
jgi:hypothetical protein